MGFRVTETIERPPPEVWATLTDWSQSAKWMSGVEGLRPRHAGPVGEGTELVFGARGRERASTIVAWDPHRCLALRSRQGGITADYVYSFLPVPEGTAATLEANCRGDGLGWRLVAPLVGMLMKRADSGQLRALKGVLEGAG